MSIADKLAIVSEDITKVYNAAKEKGYSEGTDFGFNWGYQDGYNNGRTEGYDTGYAEGETVGYDRGYAEGDLQGQIIGRSQGYEEGYRDGESYGYGSGYSEGELQGLTTGYNNGYYEGELAGYERGYEEGSSTSVPTTPTDNRTSLKYWYSYLQDSWSRGVDWENYVEVEYGEPLEEIAYPTGTQNVTDVSQFLGIYTFYEDMAGGYGQELRGLPTKKLTGSLSIPNVTETRSFLSGAKELEDAGTIVFGKPLTNVSSMFHNCRELKRVTLVQFDTSVCTDFSYMFNSCQSIASLPSFDTSSGKNFNYMFAWCSALTSIPSLDLSNATSVSTMFYQCNRLEHIGIKGTISLAMDFRNCPQLGHDTLVAIINALVKKTSGTWKLTIGGTHIAKLTQDEIDIATSKGWQVV